MAILAGDTFYRLYNKLPPTEPLDPTYHARSFHLRSLSDTELREQAAAALAYLEEHYTCATLRTADDLIVVWKAQGDL